MFKNRCEHKGKNKISMNRAMKKKNVGCQAQDKREQRGETMKKKTRNTENKSDEESFDEAYETIFTNHYRAYLEEIIPTLNKARITKLFQDINAVLYHNDPIILPREAMCVLSLILASAVSLDKELCLSEEKKGN